jgi:CBS domain-containing membrane protein
MVLIQMTIHDAHRWLQGFIPPHGAVGPRERLRAGLGVFLGIGITALVSTFAVSGMANAPLLIAPMGASAILLFAVPASPLAQPWPVIGGHMVAALVGVTTAHLVGTPMLAAPLAVALSFGVMTIFRCVHPPSGAIALIAVLGGPKITEMGYSFALVPVLLNSGLLTVSALIYNNLTGRSFPHVAHSPAQPISPGLSLTPEDIDLVLTQYGEALDISREDLDGLYQSLVARAQTKNNSH